MKGYASNTGTKRNLAALLEAGWGILLTPDNPTPRDGFRHGIDNGAWGCHQKGIPFQPDPFERLVDRAGCKADFIVLPDIVGGGGNSLALSVSWLPRLKGYRSLLLRCRMGWTPRLSWLSFAHGLTWESFSEDQPNTSYQRCVTGE